ncbi:MAG: AI-2E family transporter [Xanthobacteraceae bacterium]|nr:AI-2E family transporter [Xanthobacteraceae bacterium]
MTLRTIAAPIWILAIIALVWALKAADTIVAPIACAFFIIALAWPLQSRLQRWLPKLVALALVVCLIVLTFFAFVSVTSWALGRIIAASSMDATRFQTLYDQFSEWLAGYGIAIGGVLSDYFNASSILRLARAATQRLNTMFSFWIVVVIYVLLGLLDIEAIARNARVALSPQAATVLIDGTAATAAKFRRYMLVRTVMSLATGVMVWVLASATGLRFAAEWGVMAFALNYIPFIGPFVATFLPTLYALAQFDSLHSALAIFAGLNLIQFIIGSYIEPRVAGYALAITPFVVLFSVFFWVFVWGLFGAFIGVPITIALVTYCAQSPSTIWITRLLGAPARPADGQPA